MIVTLGSPSLARSLPFPLCQLNNINWIEFVEGASLVHQILCKDPAHVFDRMDFATRDQYRHAVERISKGSRSTSEFDVAQMVVDRSNELKKDDRGYRKNHIGYWLVGEGVAQLEKTVQYSPPISQTLHNIAKVRAQHPQHTHSTCMTHSSHHTNDTRPVSPDRSPSLTVCCCVLCGGVRVIPQ